MTPLVELDLVVTEVKRSVLGPSLKVTAQATDDYGRVVESGPLVRFWTNSLDAPQAGYRVRVWVGPPEDTDEETTD